MSNTYISEVLVKWRVLERVVEKVKKPFLNALEDQGAGVLVYTGSLDIGKRTQHTGVNIIML